MTTIAVSSFHRSIACDLQITHNGNTKFQGKTKIITLEGEVPRNLFNADVAHIGFAGATSYWADAIGWFYNPNDKPPKLKCLDMLALTSTNQIFHATNTVKKWLLIDQPFFAIGSGMHYALGVLSTGFTPEEAVKIASKHDIYSGCGVNVYNI